jgi:phenylpropionate dioxygenase-like ring-hydroxylating dioxygenase large terminal subunit
MVRNQWYAVLESREVGRRPVGVLRMGERMVFFRDASGKLACLVDRCCHRGVALSAGEIQGDHIMCPFHGLEYDTGGRCVVIPANGRSAPVPERFRVPAYPVHEQAGFVYIWWGVDPPADLEPPRYFDDLSQGVPYISFVDPWDAHYSRAIENQLDVAHLPFVHYNTIGRGNRTLVDGPGLTWLMRGWLRVVASNRLDGPPAPRPQEEVPVPGAPGSTATSSFWLDFLFPNIWQNHIAPSVRIVIAFVPVDEGKSLLYMRFYQGFVRVPILKQLVLLAGRRMSLRIAHQDRRVVETQRPKPSALRGDEQLFQADRPILEYRRLRDEAMATAGKPPAR